MKYIHFQTPARRRSALTLDQLIEETLGSFGPLGEPLKNRSTRPESQTPRAQLLRSSEGYQLQVELPGIGREDLKLEVRDGEIRLEGGSFPRGDQSDSTENPRPRYRRSISVPDEVHVPGITAKLENGLLTIDLPKSPEAVGRTIEIG